MRSENLTRNDRIGGVVLLAFAVAIMFVPRFEIADQPMRAHLVATIWSAAILLLSMGSAARPNPKLIRWAAAILFVTAPAAPPIANLIDQSLGA